MAYSRVLASALFIIAWDGLLDMCILVGLLQSSRCRLYLLLWRSALLPLPPILLPLAAASDAVVASPSPFNSDPEPCDPSPEDPAREEDLYEHILPSHVSSDDSDDGMVVDEDVVGAQAAQLVDSADLSRARLKEPSEARSRPPWLLDRDDGEMRENEREDEVEGNWEDEREDKREDSKKGSRMRWTY